VACSALKRSYRERLQISDEVRLVYLKGSYQLFLGRLRARKGHYAGEQLLASQFADLEEPTDVTTVDVTPSSSEIVSEIRQHLGL
jgi:gluconokinase